jgi:hypothetical protein
MKNIKENIKKLIILAVLVAISVFGYKYLQEKKEKDLTEKIIDQESIEAREILKTLSELGKINIDDTFFKDNEGLSQTNEFIFTVNNKQFNLKDFSQKRLAPKDFGKNNPFADKISRYIAN